ncbi:MAG: hypothetical protein WCK98_05505 [bacterium]
MSKEKNLIVVVFLAFSFLVASTSIYFNQPKQALTSKINPTVLGVLSQNTASSSSINSSLDSLSSNSSQLTSDPSVFSKPISQTPNQSQSSSIRNEDSPINRGSWDEQQGAYAN